MKKILFIHHSRGMSGATINLLELINLLDKQKYVPEVLFIYDSAAKKILEERGITCYLPRSIFYKKYYSYFLHTEVGFIKWYQVLKFIRVTLSWFLSAFIFAPALLNKIDTEIIHINSLVLSDWAVAGKLINRKIILHLQEPIGKGYLGLRKRFLYIIFKYCTNYIIAISEDNSLRLGLSYKTDIVYNFINPKVFYPIPKKVKGQMKIILYTGGFLKYKGFYVVTESLKYLNKNIKIIFAGNYPNQYYFTGIKGLYRKLSKKGRYLNKIMKAPNAIFTGYTSEVQKLISECDILISPFIKPHFSRAIIEAFAMKKPVIVSDIEGIEELVDDNKNGVIVKANDPKELASAINKMSNDVIKMKEMGEKGFEQIILKYTQDNVKRIEDVYEKI